MDGNAERVIDVVVPAYNEAGNIGRTIETLFEHVRDLPYRFELIVVDDGSDDGTGRIVKSYSNHYPITLVTLTRNFGKETALLAGLDRAHGAATIIMDADLQHPVELIERFIERWEAGFECVYGVKAHRRKEGWLKRPLMKLFYFALNQGAGVRIVPNALDFRLLDRAAVQALCSIRERVRFTKGLYAWLGFRSIGVPFVPGERHAGASHFGRHELVQLAWDGITSFSDWPLKMAGTVGTAAAAAAIV